VTVRRLAAALVAGSAMWVAAWCLVALNIERLNRWQYRRAAR
jgi:hypothetical protein